MNDDNPLKMMVAMTLIPIALFMLICVWNLTAKSRWAKAKWTRAEAQVVDDEQKKTLTLEYLWKNEPVRIDVARSAGYGSLSRGRKFEILVNPNSPKEVRRATFEALWSSAMIVGFFAVAFLGLGTFVLVKKCSEPLAATAPPSWMEDAAQMRAKFEAEAKAEQTSVPAPVPDVGSPIEIREPSESWKANVFWGLLFGLFLLVPPFFAGPDVPLWKRLGMMLAGAAWMAFMGRSAIQNRGRKVRFAGSMIEEIQPGGSRSISIYQVKKITRSDVRAKLRAFEDIGRPRNKTRGLDTTPSIVVYTLYGERGEELLRLDKNMEPHAQMNRFLERLEAKIGKVVEE